MAVISVEALTKRFEPVLAVDGLTFEVDAGTVTGFLGPNGAGKTTTLRSILGLVTPTSGSATIFGRPYAALRDPVRRVGAVLEASGFHPGRRAIDHLRVAVTAADRGGTVFVSSHALAEVAQSVDRVVIVARGRLVTDSTVEALVRQSTGALRVRTDEVRRLCEVLVAAAEVYVGRTGVVVASGTTAEVVRRATARAGVSVFEMSADRGDLEEIFLKLTDRGSGA